MLSNAAALAASRLARWSEGAGIFGINSKELCGSACNFDPLLGVIGVQN